MTASARSRRSGLAVAALPESNGGCGSYSTANCTARAVFSSLSRAAR